MSKLFCMCREFGPFLSSYDSVGLGDYMPANFIVPKFTPINIPYRYSRYASASLRKAAA